MRTRRTPPPELPLDIPLDWSADQAWAAYEWLDHLRTQIWLRYGEDIVALLRDDLVRPAAPARGDDDPPF
jgi:hypothetical protein